jgi:hypothetical protein
LSTFYVFYDVIVFVFYFHLEDTSNINLYLFMVALYYMKQIIIYIDPEKNSEVLDILNKHSVGGVAFYDVMGAGPVEHKPVPEMVRMYMTGKTIIP